MMTPNITVATVTTSLLGLSNYDTNKESLQEQLDQMTLRVEQEQNKPKRRRSNKQ